MAALHVPVLSQASETIHSLSRCLSVSSRLLDSPSCVAAASYRRKRSQASRTSSSSSLAWFGLSAEAAASACTAAWSSR